MKTPYQEKQKQNPHLFPSFNQQATSLRSPIKCPLALGSTSCSILCSEKGLPETKAGSAPTLPPLPPTPPPPFADKALCLRKDVTCSRPQRPYLSAPNQSHPCLSLPEISLFSILVLGYRTGRTCCFLYKCLPEGRHQILPVDPKYGLRWQLSAQRVRPWVQTLASDNFKQSVHPCASNPTRIHSQLLQYGVFDTCH